jgi:hypothetical protein
MKLTRKEIIIRQLRSIGYTRDSRSNHMTRNDLYTKADSNTSYYIGPRGSVKWSKTGRLADALPITDQIDWVALEASSMALEPEPLVTPQQWAKTIINQIKITESHRTTCGWGEWTKLLKRERDLWITAAKALTVKQLKLVRTIVNDWRKTL